MVMAADINSVDLHRLAFLEAYGGGIRIQGRMDKLFSVFFRRENAIGVLTYPVQESGVLEIRLAGDEFSDGLFLLSFSAFSSRYGQNRGAPPPHGYGG